jgi:predicted RNA-binding Zn ribbon-like protein
LTPTEARRLIAEAVRRPEKATPIYRRAVALREAIWRAFSRIAQEKQPAREDVELIAAEAAEALGRRQMVKTGGGHAWTWTETDELARPLWPIASAAADVLTSEADRGHLRECADDTCAWLFVDRTKNHSRRWCDMATCGSRNKVREFRERQKRVARKAR